MASYKCINCGEIRESETAGSCPVCGYKMFVMPYSRPEILKKEISDFLTKLRINTINNESMSVFRELPREELSDQSVLYDVVLKEEDDKRFPDFSTIQRFIQDSKKTEEFHERLTDSIEQIRRHIHEHYQQDYNISLEKLKLEIEKYDTVLRDAVTVLDAGEISISEVEMPVVKLHYCETPDEELVTVADRIIDDLMLLADKIMRFIKQNNIYGAAYRKETNTSFGIPEDGGSKEIILSCAKKLEEVLDKKYIVDLLSDGSDELGEMLDAVWISIKSILEMPTTKKEYLYTFDDGTEAVGSDVESKLISKINVRYSELDERIYSCDFLNNRSQEELFDIYERLIDLDSFGFLGAKRNSLLKVGKSEEKLNELIGLKSVKESITKLKAYALSNKDRKDLNIHMCFLGNPGSGKTEVARYIAGILYENGILPTKKIVEVDRSGLVSQYFGATAEKTSSVIASAMGGVLFIDEAYALGNNSEGGGVNDYGKEAIDTLVKAMEDYRGKFCVILAGYRNEMLRMLSTNHGFRSRIQFTLDFPDYSRDELEKIAELMIRNRDYTISDEALKRILDITDIKRKEPNFANAREIRNILDHVIMCQNVRCAGADDKELGLVDVNRYITEAKISLPLSGSGTGQKVLTGEEELDELIGLDSVKRMVRRIKAYAKRNRNDTDFNLHMCFYGNPGTGKTEVARILSRILYDAGVLGEAKLVETDGQGLIGRYVGETGPKTEAKINEAMNGVLFIDEAYSINDRGTTGDASGYGNEAIAVLLKEMEDRRGQFCVILAGYRNEMIEMINTNPGFRSRIQFTLDFPDYTREELRAIAIKFLVKKKYTMDHDALELLLDITDHYRNSSEFANARTVRSIIDQVIMNQNLRTEDSFDDERIIIDDVMEYIMDEDINLSSGNERNRIGFV